MHIVCSATPWGTHPRPPLRSSTDKSELAAGTLTKTNGDTNCPCSDVHVIGIRSKTRLTEKVLRAAKNLLVIGCFCIGTNQVDLDFAAKHGIAVFNSPFANSRSVAELVIGEIISLARQLGDRSIEMHRGTWNKVSSKCWEIRGKTLGKQSHPCACP
jgi:phosphoglycerate dehydrogenase-like enzyme